MKARDVMTAPVISVAPETGVNEIAALLIERRISAVPVLDAHGELLGIVSEGDLMRRPESGTERRSWLAAFFGPERQAVEFIRTHGRTARDVMTREVASVGPEAELGTIVDMLERRRIKRVPVIENGRVVGIVSRANLLHALAAQVSPARATATDASIRTALQRELAGHEWLDTQRVNIVVSDGVVHLWGQVRSAEEGRALRLAAESIFGVRGVEEHLSPDWFANTSG
jgi:CBS domain-containing protein